MSRLSKDLKMLALGGDGLPLCGLSALFMHRRVHVFSQCVRKEGVAGGLLLRCPPQSWEAMAVLLFPKGLVSHGTGL